MEIAVIWCTITSGRAAATALRTDTASSRSITTPSAPSSASKPNLAALVVVAVTWWPWATSRGTSRRPTTPVPPATNTRMAISSLNPEPVSETLDETVRLSVTLEERSLRESRRRRFAMRTRFHGAVSWPRPLFASRTESDRGFKGLATCDKTRATFAARQPKSRPLIEARTPRRSPSGFPRAYCRKLWLVRESGSCVEWIRADTTPSTGDCRAIRQMRSDTSSSFATEGHSLRRAIKRQSR